MFNQNLSGNCNLPSFLAFHPLQTHLNIYQNSYREPLTNFSHSCCSLALNFANSSHFNFSKIQSLSSQLTSATLLCLASYYMCGTSKSVGRPKKWLVYRLTSGTIRELTSVLYLENQNIMDHSRDMQIHLKEQT